MLPRNPDTRAGGKASLADTFESFTNWSSLKAITMGPYADATALMLQITGNERWFI